MAGLGLENASQSGNAHRWNVLKGDATDVHPWRQSCKICGFGETDCAVS